MKLGPQLVIHDVLYAPNLKCNLISISQLLQDNFKYGVYFSKNVCVIHDHMLRKEIGLGKLAYRVYNFSQEQANHTFVIPLYLLHQHVGHPSISVLRQFHGFSHALNSSFHDCVICFQSK